jgi:undecaprenyl-diphosphatase
MKQLIFRFDEYCIALMQRLPVAVTPLFRFASFMASGAVIFAIGGLTTAAAWRLGRVDVAVAMLGCLAAAGAINLLKLVLRRPRPVTAYVMQFNLVTNYSFPSGHSGAALLVYGLLGGLAAGYLAAPWAALTAAALYLLVLLVGLSRIYLGAHFPTDVLGGWLMGSAALLLITRLAGL